jgi:hypothetical protein
VSNAQAAAAVANAEDAKVQLTAEVANAYVSLRESQFRAKRTRVQIELQQQILSLTYQQYQQVSCRCFPWATRMRSWNCSRSQLAEAEARHRCFAGCTRHSRRKGPWHLGRSAAEGLRGSPPAGTGRGWRSGWSCRSSARHPRSGTKSCSSNGPDWRGRSGTISQAVFHGNIGARRNIIGRSLGCG